MNIRPSRLIAIGLLTIAAMAAAGTAAILMGAGHDRTPLVRIETTGTASIGGPFDLLATDGRSVTDKTFRGKWLLMFFGYTFCPDVCPTALSNISTALEKLGPDAAKLQAAFVTVDPARDTQATLTTYLRSFDHRILGLTGSEDQIGKVVKEFRIYVSAEKPAKDGDNYLVAHSAYIYLMDPDGRFVNVIQGTESGDEIASWIRRQTEGYKHEATNR